MVGQYYSLRFENILGLHLIRTELLDIQTAHISFWKLFSLCRILLCVFDYIHFSSQLWKNIALHLVDPRLRLYELVEPGYECVLCLAP